MHTTWANDPVNSPNHYTRSHPGMECIELTADTSFCLGNAILDTLANDPAIPDAEAHTWAKLRQGFPYSALACLDRLIEHERNQQ